MRRSRVTCLLGIWMIDGTSHNHSLVSTFEPVSDLILSIEAVDQPSHQYR